MTATRWSDQILGGNRQVDLPLNLVFIGTGNNSTLTTDMVRRTFAIQLQTNLERPDLKTGFKHPDLLGYIKEHRRELAIAALSIPGHYILADKPTVKMEPWGGYEGWSNFVAHR